MSEDLTKRMDAHKPDFEQRFLRLRKLPVPPGMDADSFFAGLRAGYERGMVDGIDLMEGLMDVPEDASVSGVPV